MVQGRRLILGGVELAFDRGLAGHSDADVLCHSIIDAIIGAAGLGDIGQMFPDTDATYKDACSLDMLGLVVDKVRQEGFVVAWLDCIVIMERPKLAPYIGQIKNSLASTGIACNLINVKAKTNEGMGFIGRGEGVASLATCTLKRNKFNVE
ncbi:2-C-methyl-D-erythritol 2,4-cyclodiphosphate synthase [Candidatus Magnetobacterium bavaricum]|uniref:2-C-methyl-D-erythritol 2,4-cyclodiphosphate synthase n=1 Tax=Candidatus Magnetobacterium bavaricum TaxID=29290 RepID=A0A0F3GS04_9BACT|nr:2-C-methyl-D-erythritol 2,4-cyclodiphosphate synthase [Candidatus Magnetobacterium bavaricum]